MFTDTINKCAANAARIARLSANNPLGFWVSSAMAGAYVGLGIILIFTLGNLLDPSVRPLVMGATFGIALTLVIIAGSELFTGHTMFLTFGVKAGSISHGQMWAILPQTWLGNLVGSVFVAMLYSWGGGSLLPVDTSIVHSVALAKTTAPAMVLFFKGALCNWLVCLAIWMALRTEGAAKFIAIWWCLLAFIASGYEHSIANMTLFALWHHLHVRVTLVAVDEVFEASLRRRRIDRFSPLTQYRFTQARHLFFQMCVQPQFVVNDHCFQVIDAAFEVF